MASIDIFKNGSFNADAMIENFDFSSWKTVKEASAQGDWPDINQLSQYFRTGNCLATLMYYGLKFSTIADSHIRREGSYAQDYAGGVSYIPIKRIYNPKTVTFKSRIYQKKNVGYNQGYFGVSQVNANNEMIAKGSKYIDENNSSSGASFVERTITLSNVDYIDYIYMQWYDGTEEFMDISIYYEPLEIANGGGATHIAKVTGQLKDLSSNLSDILMVSGGGGGGLLVGDTDYSGKEAGGISGSGDNSADQSTGNAFGQGESGTGVSGGGSGLYGGYKGTSAKSGGAGSGYIGNSLLSNKKMVGYNVPTSSAKGTKTESTNEVSASAVSGKPKSGNGSARIKFVKECTEKYIDNLMVSDTLNNVENKSTAQWGSPFHLNEWDNNLFIDSIGNGHTLHGASPGQNQSNLIYDSTNKQFTVSKNEQLTEGYLIPLQKNQDIYKLTFDVQLAASQGYGWDTSLIGFLSTGTNGFSTKIEKNILWMNNQTGETGEHVTDYNWHTFSYNLNLKNISYFGFSCANNQCRFKNIKIVSCDSV